MKKLHLCILFVLLTVFSFAQDTKNQKEKNKSSKREARREKIDQLMKQAEEGMLVYSKQSIFGLQFRTNGYGLFYELGRLKTNRKTNIYRIDISEIKHNKEEKTQTGSNGFIFFGNPFIYGKINNFYQVTLGFGQQYILGQKGNKNGVSVSAIYNGGLSVGLLRPYYIEVVDQNGDVKTIKYEDDKALFMNKQVILGGGGLGKGWGEMKVKPGAFLKTALRFDYGRFNETVTGLEVGISGEFYSGKIPIIAEQKDRQFFFQGYISILFGRRR